VTNSRKYNLEQQLTRSTAEGKFVKNQQESSMKYAETLREKQ